MSTETTQAGARTETEMDSPASTPLTHGRAVAVAFRDSRFTVCVCLLVVGLVGVRGLVLSGFSFSKERVDLKKPLTEMNKARLVPYRLLGSDRIPPEEVEALGTEEYIRYRLEDTRIREDRNPLKYPSLFITYYSGQPDQVPHVPEECFLGGGFQQLSAEDLELTIPSLDGAKQVPARLLRFRKESMIGGSWVPTVVYLFHVNGEYVGSRTGVRLALSNPFERYGYFSKVEVSFGQRSSDEDIQGVREAAEKVLQKVLPILEQDHWPSWPPPEATQDE